MIEFIKELFSASPAMAWSIVSVLLAMTVIAFLWGKIRWWWLNTWYSFPLIGKTVPLAKDLSRASNKPGWYKSEITLCRDYKGFIRLRSEHDFHEKVAYLTKAGDLGRRPMPALIWVLTTLMVFVEAMGFSYVLAGWTIPGASENLQQTGALGIAFLVSVVLVAFTHFAGHEQYKSSKTKQARREWNEAVPKNQYIKQELGLAHSQSADDAQPHYFQLWNRVGETQGTNIVTIATIIFVAAVAIGATYVRGQVLEKQLHQQVTGGNNENQMELKVDPSQDGLRITGKSSRSAESLLPSVDADADHASRDKALADEASIDRHGGWGTFIVLAFIFVFLQFLGFFFGYRWGFAGKEGYSAYRAIGGFTSYADVRQRYCEIADAAQAKLETLQQRMMAHDAQAGTGAVSTSRTFHDFMEEEEKLETQRRLREIEENIKRQQAEQLARNVPIATPSTPLPLPPVAVAPFAPPPLVPVAPPPPDPLYYYLDSQRQPQGPASLALIRSWVASGTIPIGTMIAPVGGNEWQTL